MKIILLKVCISIGAMVLMYFHLFVRKIEPDAVSIFLFFLFLFPWILSLIKSIELPGGVIIELNDVVSATNKLIQSSIPLEVSHKKRISSRINVVTSTSSPELHVFTERDPNLVLVEIRIEIEKRLRKISERYEISNKLPLTKIVKILNEKEVFPKEFMNGLLELIGLGNKAAHGGIVSKDASDWVLSNSQEIISRLDSFFEKSE